MLLFRLGNLACILLFCLSRFGPTMFQALARHTWAVAAVLGSARLGGFERYSDVVTFEAIVSAVLGERGSTKSKA